MARSVASKKLMIKKDRDHIPIKYILFAFIWVFTSCGRDELEFDLIVYENDFEQSNLDNITGGNIMNFEGSKVIGNYNNDGFRLSINNLPKHSSVFVSFDLLLHDSWDGNTNGLDPEQPDIWYMDLNPLIPNSSPDDLRFETTFSNGVCDFQICQVQSYPQQYPYSASPKSGVYKTLPGLCLNSDNPKGTTVVWIQKTFQHKDNSLVIDFRDQLYQTNSPDAKCDESWSIDNLEVRALIIK